MFEPFGYICSMPDALNIADFLDPISVSVISGDEGYRDGQIGASISVYDREFPDLSNASVVFIGCPEQRGSGSPRPGESPEVVRREFYRLFHWHGISLADVGNVKPGAKLSDTYAALKTVLVELNRSGKTAIVIGGSQDLTLAQYESFCARGRLMEVVGVDALIDLDELSSHPADFFLMEMLTAEPNFVRHYNHIGFQSYLVHPNMLETLDKLRFDCFRVGKVRENIEEMEPVMRNADLLSFDVSAIAHAYAPASHVSPNGFTGDEACALLRYAGLSPATTSLGIYNYDASRDAGALTARQIAQMLWYFLEGRSRGSREAAIHDKEAFNEFHIAFGEVETTFLQSKRTGRWWMQLPDSQFIACSYNDYLLARSNEVPERWLRAQERSV